MEPEKFEHNPEHNKKKTDGDLLNIEDVLSNIENTIGNTINSSAKNDISIFKEMMKSCSRNTIYEEDPGIEEDVDEIHSVVNYDEEYQHTMNRKAVQYTSTFKEKYKESLNKLWLHINNLYEIKNNGDEYDVYPDIIIDDIYKFSNFLKTRNGEDIDDILLEKLELILQGTEIRIQRAQKNAEFISWTLDIPMLMQSLEDILYRKKRAWGRSMRNIKTALQWEFLNEYFAVQSEGFKVNIEEAYQWRERNIPTFIEDFVHTQEKEKKKHIDAHDEKNHGQDRESLVEKIQTWIDMFEDQSKKPWKEIYTTILQELYKWICYLEHVYEEDIDKTQTLEKIDTALKTLLKEQDIPTHAAESGLGHIKEKRLVASFMEIKRNLIKGKIDFDEGTNDIVIDPLASKATGDEMDKIIKLREQAYLDEKIEDKVNNKYDNHLQYTQQLQREMEMELGRLGLIIKRKYNLVHEYDDIYIFEPLIYVENMRKFIRLLKATEDDISPETKQRYEVVMRWLSTQLLEEGNTGSAYLWVQDKIEFVEDNLDRLWLLKQQPGGRIYDIIFSAKKRSFKEFKKLVDLGLYMQLEDSRQVIVPIFISDVCAACKEPKEHTPELLRAIMDNTKTRIDEIIREITNAKSRKEIFQQAKTELLMGITQLMIDIQSTKIISNEEEREIHIAELRKQYDTLRNM